MSTGGATDLRGMDVERCLGDPALKQRYVTAMFDIIAPRYDDFTRSFSFGMDAGWKRSLVARVVADGFAPGAALDLACGTGDLTAAIAEVVPGCTTRGLDASPEMVAAARRRHAGSGRTFEFGDMMALPADDRSVDLVTVGYGLRNVPNHRAALAEIARVLRPGGRLAVLDFARPAIAPWRWILLAYLRLAGNWYGWRWHGDAAVYGYISRSIARFVSGGELARAVEAAGMRVRERRSHLLGGVVELVAERV